MDFKKLIESKEYDFLRTDEHLGNRIILLTLGGSYAYGTQRDDGQSDVDIRGIALERPSDLIGFTEFEQVIERETDTTIYAFNKMIGLLLNCNPNTIECLGSKPGHYLYLSDIGQSLLDNKKMFISKRCINSFSGYAGAQLARLENALARDRLPQMKKEEHILNSIRNAMTSFKSRYTAFEGNSIFLDIRDSLKTDMDKEIYVNINLNDYPLRDLTSILTEMDNIVRLYGKINHRNKKKDDNHLDKHAMHLIRLYLMALDLLEKEDIITYRSENLDLLRSIRQGKFRKEDGTYGSSFFEMIEEYKKRLIYAAENTSLPDEPDLKKVEEFVMEVNTKIVKGLI
mgnify:CR=1 FL=1